MCSGQFNARSQPWSLPKGEETHTINGSTWIPSWIEYVHSRNKVNHLTTLICYDFCLSTSQAHRRILHKIKYKYKSTYRALCLYYMFLTLAGDFSPYLAFLTFQFRSRRERKGRRQRVLNKHLHTGEMLLKRNVIVCEWQLEV